MRALPVPEASPRAILVRDGLLAAALAAFLVAGSFGAAHQQPGRRAIDAGAIALLLIVAGALAVRHRLPVATLVIVSAATLVYFLANYPSGPIWFGLIIAYYGAVASGHRLVAGFGAALCFLVFPWLDDLLGRGPAPTPLFLSALLGGLLVVFGLGEATRVRRQRVAETLRTRREEAARQAGEERLRIARELHDVLAHNISLINVQAGVALHVNEDLPDQARTALAAIKDASREALGELRSVLDVLRQTGDADAPPRKPAPGVRQLEELAERARQAGLDAHLEVEGEAVALPAPVDLAAYRIAQEALTNVIRHARAATVWLRVVYAGAELRVRVEDDGLGALTGVDGGGNGIPGMRERAAALGGRLDVGSRPGGGFQVVARLPLGTPPEPAR